MREFGWSPEGVQALLGMALHATGISAVVQFAESFCHMFIWQRDSEI